MNVPSNTEGDVENELQAKIMARLYKASELYSALFPGFMVHYVFCVLCWILFL